MSKKIKNLIAYIFEKENTDKDTAEKLLDIIYLADWKSAVERNGATISGLDYKIYNQRLVSSSYIQALEHLFNIKMKGSDNISDLIIDKPALSEKDYLGQVEKSYIDFVIHFLNQQNLSADTLMKTTYPLFSYSNPEEKNLNLSDLAKDYRENIRSKILESA